jgi:hypothetical protein
MWDANPITGINKKRDTCLAWLVSPFEKLLITKTM